MQVIFSKGNTPLSNAIAWYDGKGKWSHVSILVNPEHDLVVDSRFPEGVQVRKHNYDNFEIVEVEGDMLKAYKYIDNAKYDLKRFFWYAIKWGDKPWNNPNQMICSEFVAACMDDPVVKGYTPNQLYDYIMKGRA